MMNDQDSHMVAQTICYAADSIRETWHEIAYEQVRPCVLFKPKLYRDGNQWCALYGEDLQSGVAGFGSSPADAMWNFDRSWNDKL